MRCGVRHESCGEGTRVKVIDEGERERDEGHVGEGRGKYSVAEGF